MRSYLVLLGCLGLAPLPTDAHAQQCRKGKPYGATCIARSTTCHIASGTAVWAPDASPPARLAPSAVAQAVRDDLSSVAPVQPAGGVVPCTIARVVDGDTVWCVGGRKVRLLLIDTPELDQGPFGVQARTKLEELLPIGTETVLEFDVQREDRHGRTLAYVYLPDGRMANEEMARAGYAVALVYPPNVRHVERIRAAVREAQRAKRGLWATPAFACSPRDHRRGRCE